VEEGASVVIAGRRRRSGEAVAESLGKAALFIAADVLQESDVRRLVEDTVERLGRIDCVINNAGSTSNTSSIVGTHAEALDPDFALHVRAAFLTMKYAAPSMLARGTGCFINMSSISAHRAGLNSFGYEVAKAALVHLTRCAAIELGEGGVRVNSISPGPTLTGIFAKPSGDDPDDADAALHAIESAFARVLPFLQPMRGMVHVEDIANAALFLASDEARYVNGHDLIVDGGITAGRPASQMKATWDLLASSIASAGVLRSARGDAS
jgi:NAD(P)-dependent dehydrogenase (short-subunit alcohol dehydrogenase family)